MKARSVVLLVLGWAALGCIKYEPPGVQVEAPAPIDPPKPAGAPAPTSATDTPPAPNVPNAEWMLPRSDWQKPFADQQPIRFVTRSRSPQVWDQLSTFWSEGTEKARDPRTGQEVERKIVQIKVPLGLTTDPPLPEENSLTVAKWELGKLLYFDPILSADGKVACATCHDPAKGWGDQLPVSVGIGGQKGNMNAPTVINTVFNTFQFWDGRAASLELQAQGPVANPVEMFDLNQGPPDPHAWYKAVDRVRQNSEYVRRFREVFGTEPTRDAIAKALAAYERTVLVGNSIHDRAEMKMRLRVMEEGKSDFTLQAVDYEEALKDAAANKDAQALKALGLEPSADAAKLKEVAEGIFGGRTLFFNKARCNTCHGGDNFTDNLFHNLGVGAKDGDLGQEHVGRYGAEPLGHRQPNNFGAQKTPTLRALLDTFPYMHDGSEKTLEEVVEFYDRGGNANEYLDINMRDVEKEQEYVRLGAAEFAKKHPGLKVWLCGENKRPIIPLALNLTAKEKADLVLFMKALQGDPVDPIVADPKRLAR
ncbi:MAG TPA: cytochrome c peroxidase [Gemmatales bacterium]|nr:cytochrome c peroxidase [Gemmatales bacterium]HMP61350.1 cytochrome c peroxidase [Gemmatales bacterium]